MADYKVQIEGFTAEELCSFEKTKENGTANIVLGAKEESEVSAQAYATTVTCGRWGHQFIVYVNGPGVYWTVCPYCGNGSWTRIY